MHDFYLILGMDNTKYFDLDTRYSIFKYSIGIKLTFSSQHFKKWKAIRKRAIYLHRVSKLITKIILIPILDTKAIEESNIIGIGPSLFYTF